MLSAKQIEIFYEVYKNSSMTAAAAALNISQPAISKTLSNIENDDRTVRFRIDAILHADPAPEVIIFDSVLEPVSRSVEVIDTERQ